MKQVKQLAIAAAIATAMTLAGCTGGGGSSNRTPAPEFDKAALVATTAPGTKEVDKVTWGMSTGEPSTVDPSKAGNDSAYYAVANMCETILLTTPEFGIAENLATSAEWANDTTLVIDLRDDVKFWDGTPLTTEDVIFSFQRNADAKTGSVNASAFKRMTSVEATGPNQVTVTLSEPESEFRNALAGPAGYIVQKAFTEKAGKNIGTPSGGVMCTGPYKFKNWVAGQSITMTANPHHWKKTPLVKELELVFVDGDATLTSALLSGEIDGAFSVPAASLDQFKSSNRGTFYTGPSSAFVAFAASTSEGFAADPKVRTAIDIALDKKAAIDAALNGLGQPIKTFVPPFMWEGSEHADIYRKGYEALPDNSGGRIEEATKLVKEAGATGAKLVLAITSGDQTALTLATIVQATAEQIGLKMEIKQLQAAEFSAIFYKPEGRKGLDFVLTTGYSDTPSILQYPAFFITPNGLFNWTEYDNPEVAKAMDTAATSTDSKVAAEAFVKAQSLYVPDRPMIMFANEYTRTFLSNDLSGVVTSFSHITAPWAIDLGGK
ncbi:ABC transporter substrate-binding protein [Arthrobacter sp. S2(2024)]|uniref:ABC transporter substrate-binding protein n=1 Tax=Arthrobacter sp. S2(2024) TaxID=3111911 RepID=UPI002FCBAE87